MTTVAQIIKDAFRVSNLVAAGASVTQNEEEEALRHLNNIVAASFGHEAGEELISFPIGRTNINRPQGYPWFDGEPSQDWYVPKNVRLMANLERPLTLHLHPDPDDGTRLSVLDVAQNLDTFNLTLEANGRRIEGGTSLVLNTNGLNAEWFYRADLGEWVKVSPLDLTDTFPFPKEFEDFFTITLAVRINPAYGVSIDDQSARMLQRAESRMRARYRQNIFMPSETAIFRMPHVSAARRGLNTLTPFYDPNILFEKGWPN